MFFPIYFAYFIFTHIKFNNKYNGFTQSEIIFRNAIEIYSEFV